MSVELSYDDLTPTARNVLNQSMRLAAQHGAAAVEPVHILLGLLDGSQNLALKLLAALQIDQQQLAAQIRATLPPAQPPAEAAPSMDAASQRVIRAAFKEAAHLGHYRVDALHLLLGLLYDNDSPANKALGAAGVSLYELRQLALKQPRRFRVRYQDTLRAVVRPSPIFGLLVAIMLSSGAALWLDPRESLIGPLTFVFVLSGWITSVCIHEFSHALAAHLGGDRSVGPAGYLTLNPLRYSHPVLSVVMPIIFLLIGGLGLPGGAVYIRPDALRSSRWAVFTAAAGPLGTLCFCLLIGWPFFFDWFAWVTAENYAFWSALAFLAFLQVNALMFNLLPIPPLDGFQMLAPSLPQPVRQRAMMLGNYGFMLLYLLFSQDSPVTDAFWQAVFRVAEVLHIPLDLAFEGMAWFTFWQ
jgi:Zn-dependent protease